MNEERTKSLLDQRKKELADAEKQFNQLQNVLNTTLSQIVGLRSSITDLESLLVEPTVDEKK